MKEAKYSDIWKIIIKPYLEKELLSDSSFQLADSTENCTNARRDIESLYNAEKFKIKSSYMKDSEKLIDRHKISASLYIAMVSNPLIKILGSTTEKERLANASFAFYVSSSVLLSFMANGANPEYSKFLEDNGLQYPQNKNTDSNESYIIQTVKTLCHAQTQNKLSTLMLANIFCLLEECTNLSYRESRNN